MPDGDIKTILYWDAVIAMDDPKTHTLKVCPKLNSAHVHPKPYQKMNVALAFQVCIVILFFIQYLFNIIQYYSILYYIYSILLIKCFICYFLK